MKIYPIESNEFYKLLKSLIKRRIQALTKEFRAYESKNKSGRLSGFEKKMFNNTARALVTNENYARHYDPNYTRLQ